VERRASRLDQPDVGGWRGEDSALNTCLHAAVAAALAITAAAAEARPSTYLCGDEVVKVDFTPRKAQLHLRDENHTLQRVKSARDGVYVNRKAGLQLVANKSDLRLREGKNELTCKLQINP
jgi:hypothetical protein